MPYARCVRPNQEHSIRTSFDLAWQSAHPAPLVPRSVVSLIRSGTLDPELTATLWLLLEARVPLLVAGGPRLAGKTTLLTALLDFLPPTANRIVLNGAREDFDWLDDADPTRGYLLASELSDHTPLYVSGPAARQAIRVLGRGFGLGATLHAASLEGVFDQLRRFGVSDDELSMVGTVLVLGAPGGQRRVVAAHYVRPLSRDGHGHIQRLGPAVLATLDPATDTFEHFAWGITPELAIRVGRRPADFEDEAARRAEFLTGLAAAAIEAPAEVRRAIAGYSVAPARRPS